MGNGWLRAGLGLVLVLGLGLPGVPGAQAPAMPVPFPEAAQPPSAPMPSAQVLQKDLEDLRAFQRVADRYIKAMVEASENFRAYVTQVLRTEASCKVDTDLEALSDHPFAGLFQREARSCAAALAAFRREELALAAMLDEAMAFLQDLNLAKDSASRQEHQIQMNLVQLRLQGQMQKSLQDLDETRKALAPWMTPAR
jgi:hypothetical protein